MIKQLANNCQNRQVIGVCLEVNEIWTASNWKRGPGRFAYQFAPGDCRLERQILQLFLPFVEGVSLPVVLGLVLPRHHFNSPGPGAGQGRTHDVDERRSAQRFHPPHDFWEMEKQPEFLSHNIVGMTSPNFSATMQPPIIAYAVERVTRPPATRNFSTTRCPC